MERLPEPGGSRQLQRRPGNLLMTALRVCLPPQPQRGSRGRGAAAPGRRTAPPPRVHSGSRGQRAGRAEQPGPSRAPRKEQGEPGVWTMRGGHPMSLLVAQEGPLLSGVRTGLVGRRPRRVREPPGAETGPWPLPPPVQRDGDFPMDGPSCLFLSLATTEHWALRLPARPVPLAPPLWDSTAGDGWNPCLGGGLGPGAPRARSRSSGEMDGDHEAGAAAGKTPSPALPPPLSPAGVCVARAPLGDPGARAGSRPRAPSCRKSQRPLSCGSGSGSSCSGRWSCHHSPAADLPRPRPWEETPRPAHPPLWEEGRRG